MPYARVNNINLYYETAGEGRALLFLNGLGLSTRDWENQVVGFSKNYRVVTFDLRGQSRSDKPEGPYSIDLFASDTANLIRSLDLAPVHIVGLSLGGMIAFQLAVSAPELIRSMVIVNSGPEFILRTAMQRFEMFKRKFIVKILGMRMMGKFLAGRLFPEPGQLELKKIMTQRWAENNKKAYYDSLRALEGWSVLDRLGSIQCPTLVLSADHDYSPPIYKQWYANMMPNAKVALIADSRHATPVDQPERFNQVLMEFLSQFR